MTLKIKPPKSKTYNKCVKAKAMFVDVKSLGKGLAYMFKDNRNLLEQVFFAARDEIRKAGVKNDK